MATRIPSNTEPPEFLLEAVREGAEFTLYRARQHGNPSPVLVVAPTAKQPLPQSLRRLEHEYSLAAELEPAWAAKPLALTRHEGRTILVLADPGGKPLDRALERDREHPLALFRFLGLAINLATALGHAHQRGLIHKDVKPENALVDEAGRVWLSGFGIASRLPRERQAPAPPEMIAGTESNCSTPQGARILGFSLHPKMLSLVAWFERTGRSRSRLAGMKRNTPRLHACLPDGHTQPCIPAGRIRDRMCLVRREVIPEMLEIGSLPSLDRCSFTLRYSMTPLVSRARIPQLEFSFANPKTGQ